MFSKQKQHRLLDIFCQTWFWAVFLFVLCFVSMPPSFVSSTIDELQTLPFTIQFVLHLFGQQDLLVRLQGFSISARDYINIALFPLSVLKNSQKNNSPCIFQCMDLTHQIHADGEKNGFLHNVPVHQKTYYSKFLTILF